MSGSGVRFTNSILIACVVWCIYVFALILLGRRTNDTHNECSPMRKRTNYKILYNIFTILCTQSLWRRRVVFVSSYLIVLPVPDTGGMIMSVICMMIFLFTRRRRRLMSNSTRVHDCDTYLLCFVQLARMMFGYSHNVYAAAFIPNVTIVEWCLQCVRLRTTKYHPKYHNAACFCARVAQYTATLFTITVHSIA